MGRVERHSSAKPKPKPNPYPNPNPNPKPNPNPNARLEHGLGDATHALGHLAPR